MKALKTLFGALVVGVGVAVVYYFFEAAYGAAIDYIWYEQFDIVNNRALIVPLTFLGVFLFFAAQHYLDRDAENSESEGLGNVPKANLANFAKVLFIGFLSMVAGASLGPEAILIPTSVILGLMVAKGISKDKKISKLFTLLAFVSLFTAFFSSIIAGAVGLILALSRSKAKLSPPILIFSLISSVATLVVLRLLDTKPYLSLPGGSLEISLQTVLLSLQAVFIGYVFVYVLERAMSSSRKLITSFKLDEWYIKAFVVSAGLSLLYVLGGPLTMFTGNESKPPMLSQSQELGLLGLGLILIVKVLAIGWSKVGGLRGGMVFPSIFVAATIASMTSLYVEDLHIGVMSLLIVVGMLIANNKRHVMF
jgi:H+/Cl- antiporter ClcA